jgi:DNA-binding NarL/FixJ family response regulator
MKTGARNAPTAQDESNSKGRRMFVRYAAGPEPAKIRPMSEVAGETKPIQVALVEDDEGIRASLANILGRSPGCQLVCSCADAESALERLGQHRLDVVLMDINLPRMNGIECVRRLKQQMPKIQFIMLTVYGDNERLFRSLQAGASGYLLKTTPSAKLLAAIREVHAGGSPMTPQIARRVVQYFLTIPPPNSELEALTPRERDILDQLSQGFLYKEIVLNLGMSLDTVRTHIRNIYEKLHVRSRTEAVVKYMQRSH